MPGVHWVPHSPGLVRPFIAVESDPLADHMPGMGERLEPCCQMHSSFSDRKKRSIRPFCSGVYGVVNSWVSPYALTVAVYCFEENTKPLSEPASAAVQRAVGGPEG